VSLLRPSNIDKGAAYYHQESEGPLGICDIGVYYHCARNREAAHGKRPLYANAPFNVLHRNAKRRLFVPIDHSRIRDHRHRRNTLFCDCTRDRREASHRHHSFGRSLLSVGDKFVAEIGADCYTSGRTCRRYFKELNETVTA
jgi:hypothetical protein